MAARGQEGTRSGFSFFLAGVVLEQQVGVPSLPSEPSQGLSSEEAEEYTAPGGAATLRGCVWGFHMPHPELGGCPSWARPVSFSNRF